MSGYIINPYSSDIDPMLSVSYSNQSIPVVAYGLIGITSLTLAYLTLIDSTQTKVSAMTSPSISATSMLPSGIFTKDTEKKNTPSLFENTEPIPDKPNEELNDEEKEKEKEKIGYGGKSRNKTKKLKNEIKKRNKKNKKTKQKK